MKILAIDPGTIRTGYAVLDTSGCRVWWVDRTTGAATVVAHGLPVGHLREPYPRSGGLAVDADGVIYVAADGNNAIYAIRR